MSGEWARSSPGVSSGIQGGSCVHLHAPSHMLVCIDMGLPSCISEGNFNLAHLEAKCGISESTLDSMYKYAKFQFECGNYAGAAEVVAWQTPCRSPAQAPLFETSGRDMGPWPGKGLSASGWGKGKGTQCTGGMGGAGSTQASAAALAMAKGCHGVIG